jgi:arabinofuranan 3-O-arabinosyltransferase
MNPLVPRSVRRARAAGLIAVTILALVAVVAYGPHLELFAYGMLRKELLSLAADRDFANYWMAGHMVMAGEQHNLFDPQIYFARLQDSFGAGLSPHNWGYPPHFLLFVWPLGLMYYKSALVAFIGVTLALFVFAVWVFRRTYAPHSGVAIVVMALLGYVLLTVDATQNGFMLGASMLLGLAWMKQRPAAAGLAFAVLTVKPQLGLLLPLLLVFDRNWRTIAWTAAFTVLLISLSIMLFGLESWTGYLTQSLTYQRQSVLNDWSGVFLKMMPTVFASIRTLGFSTEHAYWVQWPISLAAAALVVWSLRRESDPLRRIFVVLCGTFLVSPYAFNYDMGALATVAALLAGSQLFASRAALVTVAVVAGLSGAVMNLGRATMPVAPLVLFAGLVTLALETRRAAAYRPQPSVSFDA